MEAGCWWTEAEPMQTRTKAVQEGRQSPMEPKGWRDKAQLVSWKSVAQAG